MNRLSAALHMALGGAACGTFLGILAGGWLGLMWVWSTGAVTAGLDWAVIGGCLFCVGGGLYGLLLAVRGEQTDRPTRDGEGRDEADRRQDNSAQDTEGHDGSLRFPSSEEQAPCEV